MLNTKREYDYIVVGAGTAGCALAAELVRREAGSVLLIEHGARANHRFSRTPVLYPHMFADARFSYAYETVPQPGLAGRRIRLPAGKGLGGSSLINAMIYMPPHRADCDAWQCIAGNDWSWDECQEALRFIETKYANRTECPLHPTSQWLLDCVSRQSVSGALFHYERTACNGLRQNANQVWLRDVRTADGLTIVRNVSVDKICMKLDSAYGVMCCTDQSNEEIIRCSKGVVVCIGTFGSPQLLAKSGFGESVVRSVGEDLVFPSPRLGENLHDHLVFPVTCRSSLETLPSVFDRNDRKDFLSQRTGSMASNIAEIGAFLDADSTGRLQFGGSERTNGPRPTIQWHVTPTHYLEYPTREDPSSCFSIAVTVLHPKSRGSIRYDSTGSLRINPQYHVDSRDRMELISAVQWARQWVATNLSNVFVQEVLPGEKRTSDDELGSVIDRLATTIYHYVGTCAIGSDEGSVCTPRFRVRGADNLYVCDGASIPSIPSGNTQVTVMMLAYRLAKWLAM